MCETFDHLYAILEERKGEMSMQITSEQEEKLDYIRSLQRKYTEHLDNMAKVLETGINIMDESEMAIFLQVRMSVCLPVCRSAPRSICLSIFKCIFLSIRLPLYLACSGQLVCLPACLSICQNNNPYIQHRIKVLHRDVTQGLSSLLRLLNHFYRGKSV